MDLSRPPIPPAPAAQALHPMRDRIAVARASEPRQAFEHAPVALATCDAQSGLHLTANARYRALTGYPMADLRELSIFQITHRDDREAGQRALHSLRSGAVDQYTLRKRLIGNAGDPLTVDARVAALDDAIPVQMITLALVEVDTADSSSHRRRVAAARRLDLIEDGPVGFADVEPGTLAILDATPALAALLGIAPSALPGLRLADLLADADAGRLTADAGSLVRGDSDSSRLLVHLAGADSAARRIELRLRFAPAFNELPPCLLLAAIDLTGQLQAEQAAQAAQAARRSAQARQTLFDLAQSGMVEVEVGSGMIVRANPAFCRMLDYPDASDLVGLAYRSIVSMDDVETSGVRLEPRADGQPVDPSTERRYFRRDGRVVTALIASAALPGPEGRIDTQLIAAAGPLADRT